ncbi:MAG TPA: hypothetical protein VFE05_22525 [Longimicrobiaceae bacterium]|jgi:predicted Zn-dependent peptidase|nr:hypothetical protein [Longimicrobiaceae bacterium]
MLALALTLAAALPAADTTRVPARAADAPVAQLSVHRQSALPLVALRLSLLADDPPGYAGAGHLFQHLMLPGLEEQVARVGGRVQIARTADAVVYTVIGPASEMGQLSTILRSTLHTPVAGTAQMLAALRQVGEERAAERETAPSYVRAALRAKLFPAQVSVAGTEAAAARLNVAPLAQVWAAMYRPERVSVTAVGDVQLAAVQRAFASIPDAEPVADAAAPASTDSASSDSTAARPDSASVQEPRALVDSVPGFAGDRAPQATRGWIGAAWPADSADPAAVTVAARLVRDALRSRLPASFVEVEHWWTHDGQALAVVVASPAPALARTRRAVPGALAIVADSVDADQVRRAAAAVRREMVFYARTPERMAEVLGSFTDRTGRRDAAQDFFAAVGAVDVDAVRRALAQLTAATRATVDVPPQKLPTTP